MWAIGFPPGGWPNRRAILTGIAGLTASTLWPSWRGAAAPRAELWSRWERHDPDSALKVDHRRWDRFLKTYLRTDHAGINRIPYGSVSEDDQRGLADYTAELSGQDVDRLPRSEQFAVWVNLYNALTVGLVLAHYPVRSIRDIDISPGIFARGPWGKRLVRVADEELSLDDIEHRILRPIWRDARIHYAVNCASLGCPNLQRDAFTAESAETLLEAGARQYVNHPRGVAVRDGGVVASSIYNWYADDFGGDDAGVIAHFRHYAEPQLARQLAAAPRIGGYDYDWALNDATVTPASQ
jgi:hypothetical protein